MIHGTSFGHLLFWYRSTRPRKHPSNDLLLSNCKLLCYLSLWQHTRICYVPGLGLLTPIFTPTFSERISSLRTRLQTLSSSTFRRLIRFPYIVCVSGVQRFSIEHTDFESLTRFSSHLSTQTSLFVLLREYPVTPVTPTPVRSRIGILVTFSFHTWLK